jgi:hypothetical protein
MEKHEEALQRVFIFSKHVAATKSFTFDKYEYHMSKIEEKSPDALDWLDVNHSHIWSRSKFSEECKIDYINNNLSESFNSWVSKIKDMYIVQMIDQIRHMIITKFEIRRKIGRKMTGRIILHITITLNEQSKNMKGREVLICGNGTTEVIVGTVRHAVNLGEKTCSCQAWQVCEKHCNHALTTIANISSGVNMEYFDHDYFFVQRFKKAYEVTFKPMTSQEQWSQVDLGYKLMKPKLRRKPRRSKVYRIK